jgi:hypothetical protein
LHNNNNNNNISISEMLTFSQKKKEIKKKSFLE